MVVSTTCIFDLYDAKLEGPNVSEPYTKSNVNTFNTPHNKTKHSRIKCDGSSQSSIYQYIEKLGQRSQQWTLNAVYPIVNLMIEHRGKLVLLLNIIDGYFNYKSVEVGWSNLAFDKASFGRIGSIAKNIGMNMYHVVSGTPPANRLTLFIVNFLVYTIIKTGLYVIHELSRPPEDENDGGIIRKLKNFGHYMIKIFDFMHDVGYILQIFLGIAPFVALWMSASSGGLGTLFESTILTNGNIFIQQPRNTSWPEYMRYLSDNYAFNLSDAFSTMLGLNQNAYKFIISPILTPVSTINKMAYYGYGKIMLILTLLTTLSKFGSEDGNQLSVLLYQGIEEPIRQLQQFLRSGYRKIGRSIRY